MKKHSLSGAVAIAALVFCTNSKTFAQTDWHITGNSGTNPSTNFLGTTDNKALVFRTNNVERMRILQGGKIGIGVTNPFQKLDVNGNINIGPGFALYMENHPVLRVDSLRGSIFLGNSAGAKNAATYNTATGYYALSANTNGGYNTATGAVALFSNTTGIGNVANGANALLYNTSGSNNTATGGSSLYANIDGSENVASGAWALYANTSGSYNSALGLGAMYYSTTGANNAALGSYTMYNNKSGSNNTAIGTSALGANYDSWNNTALGSHAGDYQYNGWNNTFIGADALAAYSYLYNSVALGNAATVTASNQVRIGNAYTTSIGGYTNWTNISDGRVKKNIKENVPGLSFINKLKAVTYNLDLDAADKIIALPAAKDKDGKLLTKQPAQTDIAARQAKQQVIYTGFIAQDVEKAAKELNYDFSGVDAAKSDKDLYGLRYSDFVVPLVKAVQELSQKVEKLEAALSEKNTSSISALSSTNITVTDASLGQNTPNPFNRNTAISYTLPQKFSSAQIIISDQNGKVVKQVNISSAAKGMVNVDASMLSSGTYTYVLVVDGKRISSKQMILAK
ncbi:MAG: tail fiber domain-containing protein [Panacibacter sp.]